MLFAGAGPAAAYYEYQLPEASSAMLFDPRKNRFAWIHGPDVDSKPVVLPDHTVLFLGSNETSYSAILYRPNQHDFVDLDEHMLAPRARPTATLLSDGRVLIAGGGPTAAEIYDYRTGEFNPAGDPGHDMLTDASGYTATLLPGDRVLFTVNRRTSTP